MTWSRGANNLSCLIRGHWRATDGFLFLFEKREDEIVSLVKRVVRIRHRARMGVVVWTNSLTEAA